MIGFPAVIVSRYMSCQGILFEKRMDMRYLGQKAENGMAFKRKGQLVHPHQLGESGVFLQAS